ncbi:hypothetical protein [Schleiferilactobacillus perolens]|nr:hypothetical protein [Schleiferilactobacillus perolens]
MSTEVDFNLFGMTTVKAPLMSTKTVINNQMAKEAFDSVRFNGD